jgi:ribokinase
LKKIDAIGFGALNVDKLSYVNLIAKEGEESYIYNSKISCGGSAANTIVGLARLGQKTGFIGAISSDEEGRLLTSDFQRENVDTKGIIVLPGGSTGLVQGFVDESGERALYVNPGVNDSIVLQEYNLKYCNESKFLHLSSFVGDTSFEAQKKLVKDVSNVVKITLDPGMLYARRGMSMIKPLIKYCFAVLLNDTELKLLTGTGLEAGAQRLLDEGPMIVGVKMASKGCFITDGTHNYNIPAFNVDVVDTTGAGDAWNAGFIYGLIHQKSFFDSGRLGNFVAARCITKPGARNGLPYMRDLKGKLS